ncbi:MAG: hypothetical protein ACOH2J_08915 [Allorhizobium sp.]
MSGARTSRNVLIVSGQHFATAPRKVDLHFIAETLIAGGDHVDFLSCRLSWISRFLKDGRFTFARTRVTNRWVSVSTEFDEFIWMGAIHPMNLKLPALNALTAPIFRQWSRMLPGAVRARLSGYSHVLVESGPAPLLMRKIRKAAPNAQIIYHAADRLQTINVHPCVEDELLSTIGQYDLIHVMAEALRADFPGDAPVVYLPHGISREVFDTASINPYPTARNAVSVGDMLFDSDVIETLAEAFPEWTFHLFGKKAHLDKPRANVVAHGEVAFETIVPFIKFADIGLAPYRLSDSADYLSQSSLKMIQYTYCRLPIVAPGFAASGRSHVCAYMPGDAASIRDAFAQAAEYDRSTIDRSQVRSWSEMTDALMGGDTGNFAEKMASQ